MKLQYNLQTIEFTVIRSRRKTVSIFVQPDGTILVKAPVSLSDTRLLELLQKKAGWMARKQEEVQERAKQKPERTYTDEEITQYKKQAGEQIRRRVEYYSRYIPEAAKINRIVIKDQKSRWGSCSSKGNLNFNWRLILAPPKVLDYVVVHEMCHLRHMNHSREFWSAVEDILPDYREWRKWLQENGSHLY